MLRSAYWSGQPPSDLFQLLLNDEELDQEASWAAPLVSWCGLTVGTMALGLGAFGDRSLCAAWYSEPDHRK